MDNKQYSNQQLFDTLERLNRYNIYLFEYFSINLFGENKQTFGETLGLARDIYEFYPSRLPKILNSVDTLDPLSPMNTHPDKYGIQNSVSTFMNYYDYCRDTQIAGPSARMEKQRGFRLSPGAPGGCADRSIERMANAWDRMRQGWEESWWPVPPSR